MDREQGHWLVTFDRDCRELVHCMQFPSPSAFLCQSQEPYAPMRPAAILFDLIAEPATFEGYFVVAGDHCPKHPP